MSTKTNPKPVATLEDVITLIRIAMVAPNKDNVYAISRIAKSKTISRQEFMEKFADRPTAIKVSFAADGVSNPQLVTAYGFGMDCWYIEDK